MEMGQNSENGFGSGLVICRVKETMVSGFHDLATKTIAGKFLKFQMNPSQIPLDLQTQKSATKTGGRNAMDRAHPRQPSNQFPMLEPQGNAEFWPLSWKPFFYVVLSRAHLAKRFQLLLPHQLSEKLPAARVPATIIYRGKAWDLEYLGDQVNKRFKNHAWGEFVTDNKLGIGDACVFELVEGGSSSSSRIKFRVQILRDNFPVELMEKAEGHNWNNPIALD